MSRKSHLRRIGCKQGQSREENAERRRKNAGMQMEENTGMQAEENTGMQAEKYRNADGRGSGKKTPADCSKKI